MRLRSGPSPDCRAAGACRMMQLLGAVLLLAAACTVDACGHHGHVLHQTKHFAEIHSHQRQAVKQSAQQETMEPFPRTTDIAARRSLLEEIDTATAPDSQPPSPAPIRIHVEYQGLDDLQLSEKNVVMSVTRTVMQVISSYIMVRFPVQGRLLLSPVCERYEGAVCKRYFPAFKSATRVTDNNLCGVSSIKPSHVQDPSLCSPYGPQPASCKAQDGASKGVETDLYIYVTNIENEQCANNVAAWALSCLYDADTNRPVLGNVNLCPHALTTTNPDDLVAVVMHETLHVLGFSDALFGLYIDPDTKEELGVAQVQANRTVNGQQVSIVTTPTVVREARAQFGCATLEGAQLEDEGDIGSANSHWEYTHYQGDLMVASTSFSLAGEPARMSRLTLALLQDTGWYVGNWTLAGGPLQWGDGIGCTLPSSGCQHFSSGLTASSSDKNTNMFCEVQPTPQPGARQSYVTTASYRSVGLCTSNKFTNGCGIVQSRGGTTSCLDAAFQYANPENFGWVTGATSRPYAVQYKFEVSLSDGSGSFLYYPATGSDGDTDAVCYPSICKGNNLYLTLFGREIRCPAGQYVDLSVQMPGIFKAGLVGPCPDEREVCRTLDCGDVECNIHGGVCYAGQCQCKLGWTGPGCAFSLVRNSTAAPNPQGTMGRLPPAPALQNFTNWRQQIQVRCGLDNMQPAAFSDVSSKFLMALSEWAGVPTALFTVQSATLAPPTTPPTTATSITGGPQPSTVQSTPANDVQGSAAAQGGSSVGSLGWLLRRTLLAHSQPHHMPRLTPIFDLGRAWRGASSYIRRRLADEYRSAHQPLVVVTNIFPSSSSQTSELMSQFADPVRQAQLAQHMQVTGFQLIQGSLSTKLSIIEETVQLPVLTPGAQKHIKTSQEFTDNQDKQGEAMSWSIILIAGCVAAGALFLALLVLIITCACKRKAKAQAKPSGSDLPVTPAASRFGVACIQEEPAQEAYVGINLNAEPQPLTAAHGEVYVTAHSPPPEQRR